MFHDQLSLLTVADSLFLSFGAFHLMSLMVKFHLILDIPINFDKPYIPFLTFLVKAGRNYVPFQDISGFLDCPQGYQTVRKCFKYFEFKSLLYEIFIELRHRLFISHYVLFYFYP